MQQDDTNRAFWETKIRQTVLGNVQRSPAIGRAAIQAIASGVVQPLELPRDFVSSITAKDDDASKQIRKLLSGLVDPNRANVIADYNKISLSLDGDAKAGAFVFAKNCLTCHMVLRIGNKVGADLTNQARRPANELIAEILAPSQRVSPDFLAYTVVTSSGRVESGLIVSETGASITLRKERNQEVTIPLSEVDQIKALDKSLMPDGLEKTINHQQMADLIAFLHAPDRNLLLTARSQVESATNE